MSKRIIFSMGARGGVGKTTVISTLADWYAEKKIPVELLDFDDENKANSGLSHFQKSARKIHVDKRDGLDVFIEIVDKTTHPIILADFGARSGRLTFNWFDTTFEHLKGLDITFTAVGVVTTDPGSVTSVLEWADHLKKRVQYLIVLNEDQTEQAVFDVWENSEQAERLRAELKPKVIRFLSINPDLQKGISNHGASLLDVAQRKVEIPELVGSRWAIRAQQVYQAASKEFGKVKDCALMMNFESLRELVQQSMPQQLEAFDRMAFRLRRFQHDDDLLLFIEAAGFVALISHQVPQAILESNASYKISLESLRATLETMREDRGALERAHSWAEQTAKDLDRACKRVVNAALDVVTHLDTKALSEKLSVALLQSIEQSVQARGEIITSAKALGEVSSQYREDLRQFRKWHIPWIFGLAWLSALLFFGTLYFVVWENHRQFLDDQAKRQLAVTLDAARELQKNGVDLKVVQDHGTIYLILPGATKAYLSNSGEGVIAVESP